MRPFFFAMRIALGIEYDGQPFRGWQAQKHGVPTVQTTLEAALSKVAAHPVSTVCAGRTDTGVHGIGQVVHFDTDAVREPRNWLLGSNVNLPPEVSVTWAKPVSQDFHARFSATARSYRYLILNRPCRSALLTGKVTWIHRPLDAQRMHQAAQHLLGTHDFSSYRALGCQAKSPVRTVTAISVQRHHDLIELSLTANAFLHHMVRNIAGVLITIGQEEQPVVWSREVLGLQDRTLGGVTAPPHGLYLNRVVYPDAFGIPVPPPSGFPPTDSPLTVV